MKMMLRMIMVFGLLLSTSCVELFAGAGALPTQQSMTTTMSTTTPMTATPSLAMPASVAAPVPPPAPAVPTALVTPSVAPSMPIMGIPGATTTAIHVGYVCKMSDPVVHFEEGEAKKLLIGFPAQYRAIKISDLLYDSNPPIPLTCWCFVGWTTGLTKTFNGKPFLFEESASVALMNAIIPHGSFAPLPREAKIALEAKVVCSSNMTPDKAKGALREGVVITSQPTTISTLPGQQCYIVAKSDVDFKVKRKGGSESLPIQEVAQFELAAFMRCKSSLSCPQ